MAVPPPLTLSAPDKPTLRRELRGRRRAFVAGLDAAALNLALESLAAHAVPRLDGAQVVAGYVAIAAEVDPLPILAVAHAEGRGVALPFIEGREAALRFVHWTPGDPLEPGPFGLLQPSGDAAPAMPDLILTPLVGFDRALNRLGQGAGHYDRAFAALPAARRIGLAWSVQEAASLPADPWDVPLHGLATEREWISADA